jgi:triacylglycerol lipase
LKHLVRVKLTVIIVTSSICFFLIAISGTAMAAESIVLLHGLGRTQRSMRTLATHLGDAGFDVINIDYPSRCHPIEELASIVGEHLRLAGIDTRESVHFVTHSLGGILVRWLHREGRIKNIGRVVMLSPPNRGSEVADNVKRYWLFRKILGPPIRQLGTDQDAIPSRLGPVDFELGVITGSKSLNPLFSYWVPGHDDGKVSTERAKVAGMKDFLVLPHSHGFIMNSPEVVEQVIYFLQNGQFKRNGQS